MKAVVDAVRKKIIERISKNRRKASHKKKEDDEQKVRDNNVMQLFGRAITQANTQHQ